MPKDDFKIIPIMAKHPLVGVWRPADPEMFAEYTITAGADRLRVVAVDRHDGEEFEISNVSWDGETLRFTSRMPSTRWELRNEFRAAGPGELDHRFTRRELLRKAGGPRVKEIHAEGGSWLAGAWESPDTDETVAFGVRRRGAAFTVEAIDRDDGERLSVSDVSWDGRSLRFKTSMRSANLSVEHELRALSESDAEHIVTERQSCIRVG